METSDYDINNETLFYIANFTIDEIPHDTSISSVTILISALIVTTVIANAIMLFLLHSRRSAGRIDVLLTNLTIANLLVILLIMPEMVMSAYIQDWQMNDFTCHAMLYLRDFPLFLIAFLLVCIAIDRYEDIKHPLRQSNKKGTAMVIMCWSLAALCCLPEALLSHLKEDHVVDSYMACTSAALAPLDSVLQEIIRKLANQCAIFALPAIIIMCLYGLTYLEISRKRRITKQSALYPSLWNDDSKRVQKVFLKMNVTMACFFIICSLPATIMYNWSMVYYMSSFDTRRWIFLMFLLQLLYSTISPIIYIVFHLRGNLNTEVPILPTSE